MELSRNALTVLEARYLLRDEKGALAETPEEMFRRVARLVAKAESLYGGDAGFWEERFYQLMSSLRFLPNSPALMNAGRPRGQLAACFVLPVEDSIGKIFDTLKSAALIHQSGGGTGFSFSRLRPRDDTVNLTGGVASGPVSFIKVYNSATEALAHGGARRGANMGILRVDHPDILDFVRAKRETAELSNFNLSVAVTDDYMEALKRGGEYDLVNPRSGRVAARVSAREIFEEIVESAWQSGDPGLVFIDRINRSNPTPRLGPIESTNPCGEQPLLPYEACVLGSLNLSKYIASGGIEFGALREDIGASVRFLDNAIDVNVYPVPEIENMHKGNRKTGLGIMGWADMLTLLGLPYDSNRAFDLARKLMRFVRETARAASAEIARTRGVFPNFEGSVYDAPEMPRLRNATTTTIAPTGTLSVIADCSSGIEPLFAVAFTRRVLGTTLTEVNRHFVERARKESFYTEDLMADILRGGSVRRLRQVPLQVRRVFRTAMDISAQDHIEMQAAFQEHTDNAVSKTINLPRKARREDVWKAFLLAYEKGTKGITVFRYGSKKGTLSGFSAAEGEVRFLLREVTAC